MWVAKITLKFDASVMGRRCHRYKVTSKGLTLPSYPEGKVIKYPHFETLTGEAKYIGMLIEDLHNDPSISEISHEDNMVFFLKNMPASEPHPRKISSSKIFFTKPIQTDKKGRETWTVGSWSETILKEFIVKIKKEHLESESDEITKEPLDQVCDNGRFGLRR